MLLEPQSLQMEEVWVHRTTKRQSLTVFISCFLLKLNEMNYLEVIAHGEESTGCYNQSLQLSLALWCFRVTFSSLFGFPAHFTILGPCYCPHSVGFFPL